jgi:hypothetical protein
MISATAEQRKVYEGDEAWTYVLSRFADTIAARTADR